MTDNIIRLFRYNTDTEIQQFLSLYQNLKKEFD